MADGASGMRRLSDGELLNARFRYTDPEHTIEGLNPGVPDPEANPTIIGYYDETPPGGRKANPDFPFVRCCHCGFRRHWKGRVVHDDKGEIYIIGASGCGREHYGIKYEHAERAFRAEQARQTALQRWRRVLELRGHYAAEVDELLASPQLRSIELKRDELRKASREGFGALSRIANGHEPMFERRDERDFAKEEQRRQRYELAVAAYDRLPSHERKRLRKEGLQPELDETALLRHVEEPLGHLVGGDFLVEAGDIRKHAIALRESLDAVTAIEAKGTDSATLIDLTRRLREMTDRPKALRDALVALTFVPRFFEPENLKRIERWSRAHHHRFSYAALEQGLGVWDMARGETIVAAPKNVELPACARIMAASYLDENFQTPLELLP